MIPVTKAVGIEKNKKAFLAQKGVLDKLEAMSENLGVSVDEIVYVIGKETAGSYSSKQKNLGGGDAVGLIQFLDTDSDKGTDAKTINGKSYKLADLELMDEVEQLDVVEQYFIQNYQKKKGRPGQLYLSISAPAFVGKPDDYVAYKAGSQEALDNKGWQEKDGSVTIGKLMQFGSKPEFQNYESGATVLSESVEKNIDATFDKYNKHINNLKNPTKTLKDYNSKEKNDMSKTLFGKIESYTNASQRIQLLNELHEADKVEGVELEQYVKDKKEKTKEYLKDKSVQEIDNFLKREEKGISDVYVNKSRPGAKDTRNKGPYQGIDKNDRILNYEAVVAEREKTESTLNSIIENKDSRFSVNEVLRATELRDNLLKEKAEGKDVFDEEAANNELYQDYGPASGDIERTRKPYTNYKKTTADANKFILENQIEDKLDLANDVALDGTVTIAGEDEEAEPYDSTEGGKYVDVPNIAGAEYEEKITTDGLLSEGQGSEVSLDSDMGLDVLSEDDEGYSAAEIKRREAAEEAAKLARKQARNAKIGKIADVLGQAGKAAGVALMAGAGLTSMYEATRKHKINKVRISPLMEEAFQKAKALSTQGMTYEERTAAMSDMNNAYAGAMKNVMAVSGGQRSSALANMGVVDASRVNALVDLAGKDAALRQGNMKIYQQQATSLGQMTLSADSTNEQLRATLEEGRKNRLTKIGDSLFSESIELSRNFADQKNNKDLLDNFAQLKKDVGTSDAELKALLQSLSGLNTGNTTD